MNLNDVLTKQNVLAKILLKDANKELSKELKVKIMRIRMTYNKIKKDFDESVKEFTENLVTDDFRLLHDKLNRSSEEEARLQEMNDAINSEYQEFLVQKGKEEVIISIDDNFNIDEYEEIIEVNAGNNVEINGNRITAPDFLEIFCDLFVKE